MRALTALLATAFLPAVALSDGFYSQLDWSGGGGDLGPDISFGNTFYTSENICWDGLPGYILLGVDATQHPISDDMYGCNYAFPADMDGDGDMDVVASQTLGQLRVMWFENDGSGGGWEEHEIAFNHSEVQCAYPGDMDGDGDMDVVGANPISNRVEWWRNEDGVGDTWQMFTISDYFGNTYFACCADIDGDGVQEPVAVSTGLAELAWWESETTPPDSAWQKHVVSNTAQCRELFTTDLDQDGDIDILAAIKYPPDNSSAVSFYENIDDVGQTWEETIVVWSYTRTATSVHAADVDGDAEIDIVACGEKDWKYPPYERYLSWVENEGFGDSWEEHLLTFGDMYDFFPEAVHAADLTSDGLVDIVCAEGSQSWDLTLWRNVDASDNTFAEFTLKTGPWFTDVDAADFDGDGKLDLLVAAALDLELRWFDIDPYLQGSLTSTILDAQGWPEWESIEWTSVEPEGTDITFQIRGSNDPDEMGAWSDTLTEPGSLEGHLDSAYRFVQYRVHLQADSGVISPYLEQVMIHFSSMGVEEGQEGEPLALSATPNPFADRVSISLVGSSEEASVRIYDLSGRVIRKLLRDEAGSFEWNGLDASGAEVPSGCYVVRASGKGTAVQLRLIKL